MPLSYDIHKCTYDLGLQPFYQDFPGRILIQVYMFVVVHMYMYQCTRTLYIQNEEDWLF